MKWVWHPYSRLLFKRFASVVLFSPLKCWRLLLLSFLFITILWLIEHIETVFGILMERFALFSWPNIVLGAVQVSLVGKILTANDDNGCEQNADNSVNRHRIRHRSSKRRTPVANWPKYPSVEQMFVIGISHLVMATVSSSTHTPATGKSRTFAENHVTLSNREKKSIWRFSRRSLKTVLKLKARDIIVAAKDSSKHSNWMFDIRSYRMRGQVLYFWLW